MGARVRRGLLGLAVASLPLAALLFWRGEPGRAASGAGSEATVARGSTSAFGEAAIPFDPGPAGVTDAGVAWAPDPGLPPSERFASSEAERRWLVAERAAAARRVASRERVLARADATRARLDELSDPTDARRAFAQRLALARRSLEQDRARLAALERRLGE